MPPTINHDKCTQCLDCADECPAGVLEIIDGAVSVAHPERCVQCSWCAQICEDEAITL